MKLSNSKEKIENIRSFNRFYTKLIGLLDQGLLKTPYSLTQARILFEIAHLESCTLSDLIKDLDIDGGYLSRILADFEKREFIQKTPSKKDSRRRLIKLLPLGRGAFSVLNDRAAKEIESLLKKISLQDQQKIIHSMQTIKDVFSPQVKSPSPFLLRFHRNGDIGWIIFRHGVYYAEEYGFNESFEALVADILVQFNKKHDPGRERIWMVEQAGERVGSVMVTDAGDNVSQLRLLLVEPQARGQGLGRRLIEECIHFSRENNYQKIKLWTVNILKAAHHLYEKTGFKMVEEKSYNGFGPKLFAQTWELKL